ncbi:unnamed protein product [Brassica rapa subsp. narinosa]
MYRFFGPKFLDKHVYMQPSYPSAPASNAQPSMRTTFVPSTPPALCLNFLALFSLIKLAAM